MARIIIESAGDDAKAKARHAKIAKEKEESAEREKNRPSEDYQKAVKSFDKRREEIKKLPKEERAEAKRKLREDKKEAKLRYREEKRAVRGKTRDEVPAGKEEKKVPAKEPEDVPAESAEAPVAEEPVAEESDSKDRSPFRSFPGHPRDVPGNNLFCNPPAPGDGPAFPAKRRFPLGKKREARKRF